MTTEWETYLENFRAQMRKLYSEPVVQHATEPRNTGSIEDEDGYASLNGMCGDTMEIWIKVNNDTITQATFMTDGCATSIASGSMTTELAKGKTVTQALNIREDDVLEALEGLPEDSEHCAQLAADTLNQAVREYLAFKKEPWKKAYRKR